MRSVGIRSLKQNASRVVADVVAGETIVVTDHGRPVAQLVPWRPSTLDTLRATGRVSTPVGHVCDLPSPSEGGNLTEALLAMRAEDER